MAETPSQSGQPAPHPVRSWGVVVFPGTNCELETLHVLRNVLGQQARPVWHTETDLADLDAVVIAGGFAHGDYLRSGAVARFSPVMRSVEAFARAGGPVLGICNGFQVLLEAGLLPGAMLHNRSHRFVCRWVHCRVDSLRTPFLGAARLGEVLKLPIAHGEGNYFCTPEEMAVLNHSGQVALRYCESDGTVSDRANPNGSTGGIAGICNEAGNVMGLMPHPERASERILGSDDGLKLFAALVGA